MTQYSLPGLDGAQPESGATLADAIVLHKAGHLDDAERIYRRCLGAGPDQSEARYYLAGLLQQRQQYEAAIAMLRAALSPDSREPLPATLKAQAWLNLGVSWKALGNLQEAVSAFEQALALQPASAGANYNLGVVRGLQLRYSEAVEALRRAIALRPQHAKSHASLGAAYAGLRRADDALQCSERALILEPGLIEALRTRATALWALRRIEEAFAAVNHALALYPDDLECQTIRAHVLLAMERYDDIRAWTHQRLALEADDPTAWGFEGAALSSLQRASEAIDACDRALALKPENTLALVSKAHALTCVGRDEEALLCLDAARIAEPDDPIPEFNQSLNLLALGRLTADAWQAYEARWRAPGAEPARYAHLPRWTGREELRGKSLLVWTEQGFGDTIQFCRLFTKILELGADLVVEVHPILVSLIQSSFPRTRVHPQGSPGLPACDYQVPLMSLPGALAITLHTIPAVVPYLAADPGNQRRWAQRVASLAKAGRRRIGIACSGNVARAMLRSRAVPLASFAPLWLDNEVFLLQKDLRPEDAEALGNSPVHDVRMELGDFNDTAALIAALDAVVSVDTAVAHLAGALGKPLNLLLPMAADWRWMRERSDSPWYPSARLFRQKTLGDWDMPLRAVISELQ